MSGPSGYRGVEDVHIQPDTMPMCIGIGIQMVPTPTVFEQAPRIPTIQGHPPASALFALMMGGQVPVQIGPASGVAECITGVMLRVHDLAQLHALMDRLAAELPPEQRAEYDACRAEVDALISDMPLIGDYVDGHGPFDGDAPGSPASTERDK